MFDTWQDMNTGKKVDFTKPFRDINLDLLLQSWNRAHDGRIAKRLLGSDFSEDGASADPRGTSTDNANDTNGS
jgi:hypothetical protein